MHRNAPSAVTDKIGSVALSCLMTAEYGWWNFCIPFGLGMAVDSCFGRKDIVEVLLSVEGTSINAQDKVRCRAIELGSKC